MPLGESQAQAVRPQLERILESPGFARNERLSRFLRFVVEQHLEGKGHELKESVIGVAVFGRRPDYDPKHDAIVRTEAGRLRARLHEYYMAEGTGDPLVIELPKGGYIPAFRQADAALLTASRAAPRGMKTAALALVGLAAVVAAMGWWWIQHPTAPLTIAVLPLQNLSSDPANEYFADGLTDEIIRNLSIIDGLRVRSRTSSFAFKGKPRNVREVGTQLGADYILEGSVLRDGQQLRINAQLVRVRDDFPLWTAKYDREVTDVFAIQEEISRGIVNGLRLRFGRGRRRYETSVEAYDLYLRARSFEYRSGGLAGYNQSISHFQQAIAKDPSFAPAYAGLAAASAYVSGTFNVVRANELAKTRAAAEKAIDLDPLLAEAHDALGIANACDGQWARAEQNFRRAIEFDPSSSRPYCDFALYLLLPLGRIEEAVRQMRAAERSDPLSLEVHRRSSYVLLSADRFEEASSHCEKLPKDGADWTECLGRVRIGQGRIDEAIQILAAHPNPRYFGHALGRAGRREEAERLASTVAQNPFQQALIFAGLGDRDRVFDALERMTVQGPVRIGLTFTNPEFALLRGDPRTKALRKKVGLPE